MEKGLLEFISEYNLSPFNESKTIIRTGQRSIFKTQDAKATHQKVLSKINQNFTFPDTPNLFHFFNFTNSLQEINQRQEFFKKIKSLGKIENNFLENLAKPRPTWKPEYDVIVVTEDADTFNQLKEMNCPAQLLISETDVSLLESRDVVQVLDCPEFGIALESLPQAVFLNSIEEAYLERYLEKFSGWIKNLEILSNKNLSTDLTQLISDLKQLIPLTQESETEILEPEKVEEIVEKINQEVYEELKKQTISGESLVAMLNKEVIPENLKELIQDQIKKYNLPLQVINIGIPSTIDQEELERLIKQQSSNQFSNKAESIKENSEQLKQIPKKLNELSNKLILFDFIAGISKFIEQEHEFIENSHELYIENSKNIFLQNAHPISFNLTQQYKCSILTGANSGGKTTLIEHVIQLISLYQLGLPVSGKIKLPLFEEIYYFAKNKGSMSKGAFETLLTQMSQIKPGNKTLILADEIEAVTEPGVAGKIISATAEYYINKNCYLIIATHLGHEIKKSISQNTRIDGIEATGLNNDFELIVNHNPVLGRIAHSTPELIVEKMSKLNQHDYFRHLNEKLKNNQHI